MSDVGHHPPANPRADVRSWWCDWYW